MSRIRARRGLTALAVLFVTASTTVFFAPSASSVEAAVVTSPLVGATRIDQTGAGRVAEIADAGSYVYLRLEGDVTDRWMVLRDRDVAVGQAVQWRAFGELHDFHSARLDRVFPHLMFATLIQEDPS